ncbi:hypothetical protein ACWDUH_10405, partial [Micromonospora wenchangensis]
MITSGKAISMECQERAMRPYRIDDRHVSRASAGTTAAFAQTRERPDRMVGALCSCFDRCVGRVVWRCGVGVRGGVGVGCYLPL